MTFVFDSLSDGGRFRMLCVIDYIARLRGYPCTLVRDNGAELQLAARPDGQGVGLKGISWRYGDSAKPYFIFLDRLLTNSRTRI